jgi:hypothetical protein
MGTMAGVVRHLRKELERAQKEVLRFGAALAALGRSNSNGSNRGSRGMNAAARRKISLSQKARWARQKQAEKAKRTISAVARKKISLAQKARWAKKKRLKASD